ncbi:hypothetical protein [Parashewanella tropica]|uniref:hypothetical protein n=1 Tax=Parashewanella tropica TaxID=2547970 RepID=UPI00105990F9|nr:hypothetical protein [Parashewanella tropica]
MDIIFAIPAFLAGLYILSSVFYKQNRMNWAMTDIETGSLTNLGLGLFFMYGSGTIIFVDLPFQSFTTAIFVGVAPAAFFFFLIYKGYKADYRKHKTGK